jgi:hypothetical protein
MRESTSLGISTYYIFSGVSQCLLRPVGSKYDVKLDGLLSFASL